MTDKPVIMTRQGFTLIELIAAMVLVGVAVAIVGVSFMSFERIGKGINARNAQLAQQRLELILAEKRKKGFPESGEGPDPCQIHSLDSSDIDACDLEDVVFQNSDDNGDCNTTQDFFYCEVTVKVEDIPYTMRLYNYNYE
jgi:prepilin-type N-terminal cleavage/methylation domain-containing protein